MLLSAASGSVRLNPHLTTDFAAQAGTCRASGLRLSLEVRLKPDPTIYVTDARVMLPIVGVPHSRIVSVSSARRMSMTRSTPAWPNAESAQI